MPKSIDKKIKNINKQKGLALSTVLLVTAAVGALGLVFMPAATEYIGKNLLLSIMWGVGNILYYIFREFCSISAGFFDQALTHLTMPITTNATFVSAWVQVRNLANMLIVLGFVVVGISFALRIESYGTKKVLFNLILVALLVNFSGLFCGVIIDAANLTSASLLQQGTGSGSGAGAMIYGSILNTAEGPGGVFQSANFKKSSVSDGTGTLTMLLPLTFMFLFCGITLFYLACIFIARYAVLAFLFILSPIAFVFWVFPVTKKLWNDWWEHFIKWTFIGVGGSFLMWIGLNFLKTLVKADGSIQEYDLITAALFFYVGMKAITKSSAKGASAVMGLAGGALGFAAGSIMGATGTGSMASKLGLGSAGQA